MKNLRKTNVTPLFPVLVGATIFLLAGCGDSAIKPPPQAVMHPAPATLQTQKTWTKEDKIATIQKAGIPEEQKKAEIAKVNAGKD